MKRKFLFIILFVAVAMIVFSVASAQDASDRFAQRELPDSVAQMRLSEPVEISGLTRADVDPSLIDAEGPQEIIIRLQRPSISEQGAQGSKARAERQKIKKAQRAMMGRIKKLDKDAEQLGDVQVVLNAIFATVDASAIPELAQDPDVLRIAPVGNYELDLSETVPYIGASAVQGMGFDGEGIRVAVIDTGIDYYHAAFGGSGDPNDYINDDPTIIEPGTFPTAKVVGGFDFVGAVWPDGPLLPDPDPLDDGPTAGHGTHVADIIGGVSGVAPGVDLYALKVCSSVSTSCSGVALIQAMEFAVDPNSDGKTEDHVDIINMSLGSTYGQPFDDDLSLAVTNATAVGVLSVVSAGNSADKPYVTGSPSSSETALSVAQTQVPSAGLQFLNVDGDDYQAVFQPWSTPLASTLTGDVKYGDGAGGNLNGCAPFAGGSLAGEIVLVDRGACNFTSKIFNVANAGGIVGIIGLVAPGAPFSGGFADPGGPITIPGYMISQADSTAIKGQIGGPGIGTVDPANQLPLKGQMVGSSSRGPQNESTNLIKPEIGAPGASISALAGSGTGVTPFGGTSGAAPMVTGSAALLKQAEPYLSALELKAKLMNNGETNIDTDPFTGLAPITRIGGGEVRVDDALAAPAAAWDNDVAQGALSFGFQDISKETVTLHKKVRVRNYSDMDIEYQIIPTFRYDDDALNGAVSVQSPKKVKVKAGKDATFPVKLTIKGELLRGNFMNSGTQGANGNALTLNEYDGYLILDDGYNPIHLPWQVLPRQAANVVGRSILNFQGSVDSVALTNNGVGVAQNDAYSLLAVSPNKPEGGIGEQSPMPDIRAVGINTFPVDAGFCSGQPSFVWAFAVNTWERQEHLLPVSHQVSLDTNQDGAADFVVLNRDVSFSGVSDGRQLTWAFNLATGGASAFFFAEHSMNTGNTVLYICGEQIGLTGTDMLATNVDMEVFAQDFYYGGPGDLVTGLTVTPLGEQYLGLPDDIAGKSEGSMTVIDFGPFPGNTPEVGVMLVTNGDRGSGARGGATQATEAKLFYAP